MTEQERTTEFFNQNVSDLAKELQDRVLVDQLSGKKVQLTWLEPYPRVGPRYRYIIDQNMQPGELWIPYFPVRRMRQSLIIAKSTEPEVGACVRALRANYYDLEKDKFVPMQREGDIANFLEMGNFERAQLRFLNDSDMLYIIRGELRISANPISPADANGELKRLLQ